MYGEDGVRRLGNRRVIDFFSECVKGGAIGFFECSSDSDSVGEDFDAFHAFKHGAHGFSC